MYVCALSYHIYVYMHTCMCVCFILVDCRASELGKIINIIQVSIILTCHLSVKPRN